MLNNLELNIKRSNRRTISIYVERDGRVSVLAPEKISEINLNEIIRKKEYL
jgi:predicted metal-dependent hydrolase